MTVFENLRERLVKAQQDHLLKFWDELSIEEQQQLCEDISELNFNELKTYYERATACLEENSGTLDDRIQPIPDSKLVSISRSSESTIEDYRQEGYRQISEGHVGVLLMAGGQGKQTQLLHSNIISFEVDARSSRVLAMLPASHAKPYIYSQDWPHCTATRSGLQATVVSADEDLDHSIYH